MAPAKLNLLVFKAGFAKQVSATKDIKKLLKSTKTDNEGVVAKCWNADHHRSYNYKDFKRYKYHQDADWVVDYENSDLIAHQPRGKSK